MNIKWGFDTPWKILSFFFNKYRLSQIELKPTKTKFNVYFPLGFHQIVYVCTKFQLVNFISQNTCINISLKLIIIIVFSNTTEFSLYLSEKEWRCVQFFADFPQLFPLFFSFCYWSLKRVYTQQKQNESSYLLVCLTLSHVEICTVFSCFCLHISLYIKFVLRNHETRRRRRRQCSKKMFYSSYAFIQFSDQRVE